MVHGLDLVLRQAKHAGKGGIGAFDLMIGVQDQDAIGCRIQHGIAALLLAAHLGIQTGVAHGDGCLVGETGKERAVVGRKGTLVITEDINEADHFPLGD